MLKTQIYQTIIRFPEITLKVRDAHKLRGYFAQLFKEYSPLLHNHFEDGSLRYAYPLVQYKVVDNNPVLVGINEGSNLLTELFLKIKMLNIQDNVYYIKSKNIENNIYYIENFSNLFEYKFLTLWMALNEKNYAKYLKNEGENKFLDNILIGNILSFYKGIGIRIDEKILVKGNYSEHYTSFKNKKMMAFNGKFITNAILPDMIGIGKSTSRGFGTIIKVK